MAEKRSAHFTESVSSVMPIEWAVMDRGVTSSRLAMAVTDAGEPDMG